MHRPQRGLALRQNVENVPERPNDDVLPLVSLIGDTTAESRRVAEARLAGQLGREIFVARATYYNLPLEHPDRLIYYRQFARLLRGRYDKHNDSITLKELVALHKDVLRIAPEDDALRAEYHAYSALLFVRSKGRLDGVKLDLHIDHIRTAIRLVPSDLRYGMTFATLVMHRCKDDVDFALLNKAILHQRQALSQVPAGTRDHNRYRIVLARLLMIHVDHAVESHHIAEALWLANEANSKTPVEQHRDATLSRSTLAALLVAEMERTGMSCVSGVAINLCREALRLCSIKPQYQDRTAACRQLAAVLTMRFLHVRELQVLDDAINLYKEAVSSLPEGHNVWFSTCADLAYVLMLRSDHTLDECTYHTATIMHTRALKSTSTSHSGRARLFISLSKSLWSSSPASVDLQLIDDTIQFGRASLPPILGVHSQQVSPLLRLNLAVLMQMRSSSTGSSDDLQEVESLYHAFLQGHHGFPSEWLAHIGLAKLYLDQGSTRYSLARALVYLRRATLPYAEPDNMMRLVQELTSVLASISTTGIAIDLQRMLLQCYSGTIDLLSRLNETIKDRLTLLRFIFSCHQLGPTACFLAHMIGDPDKGVQLFERARGVLWTQASEMGTPWRTCRFTGNGFIQICTRGQYEDMKLATEQGRASRLEESSIQNLARTSAHHTVIVLSAVNNRCQAWIIHQGASSSLLLSDMAAIDLSNIAHSASALPKRSADDAKGVGTRLGLHTVVCSRSSRSLGQLWSRVVKPILAVLKLEKKGVGEWRPRIHWCPTGPFMFVPLHAAGVYEGSKQECCADYAVSSYTPTVAAVLRHPHTVSSIMTNQARLAAFAAEDGHNKTLPRLNHARAEVEAVVNAAERAHVFVDRSVAATPASIESVIGALSSANIAHLACHGVQDATDALSSGFCLTDGMLTVSQLMKIPRGSPFLAFLSACETAKGDREQPDQLIHLAATMLFLGFRSVIATMWAMNDIDGPVVARLFYERLLAGAEINTSSIAYALDYAVTELRRSGIPPERWATFIHMCAS